jgi:methylmalonyl-CoA/ethylmalonyl-CoA epimerase
VVGIGGLTRWDLPEAEAQALGARLAADASALTGEALASLARLVELRFLDVDHAGVVASSPVFGRIDHIGVAVEDLDEAVSLYRERLGMELQHRETVESQGVEAILLGVGESHVELLRPLGPDTAVGRFLERNGPGLHHVAYGTDDIEQALDSVRSAGLRLIDEQPRVGIRSSRVAFLHPKSTGGVLTELVEAAEGH